MKKLLLFSMALLVSASIYAQRNDNSRLKLAQGQVPFA